jgi:tRNA(fMet)-specific endonuclease VapC
VSTFILDSNIISFYLKGNEAVSQNMEQAVIDDHAIIIAPIAYYEVKRGLRLIGATKQLEKLHFLCELFPVGAFDNELLETSVDIYVEERKAKRNTEDADILTAAFCRLHDYILVTDNTKHFQNIEGLRSVNWSVRKS